jgi:ferrous iron transport protein B
MYENHAKTKIDFRGIPKVALVGNPNVGKSVIFSHLTGRYVTVSNYPGTTVEIMRGIGFVDNQKIGIIDTPGVNGLLPMSEDERVARDVLLYEAPTQIVQVADSKNMYRSLLLAVQLIETNLPLVLNLNMIDEALQRRIAIDIKKLENILGIPVVATVATEGEGVSKLKKKILEVNRSGLKIDYGDIIEEALGKIEKLTLSSRAVGLMLLGGDESIKRWVYEKFGDEISKEVEVIHAHAQGKYALPLRTIIIEKRRKKIEQIMREVVSIAPKEPLLMEKLGRWIMRPVLGIPLLLLVLYLMYKFVGELAAQTGVDFFEEIIFGKYFNPFITDVIKFLIPINLIQELLVGEYGLITMALTYALAIILPIISAFFIFFSILEDSGYLPRLAILLNRIFRIIGLSGKAIIPMVLGLGCDTMATMTTRTLETKKERIIATLLLALAIPCSAQLGVILGMIGALSARATLVWAGVVIAVFIGVGFLAKLIIPGKPSDFVLEIPPLRIPKLSNILSKTLARIEWYLKEAVPLFILGTFVLFLFDKIGFLRWVEIAASPLVVNFLGLPVEATEMFIVGFLRRDYGAAGLFMLARRGLLDPIQIVVSLVTITLFVPCVAQFFVMIKERGLKTTLAMVAFIFPFAFLAGGILNMILRALGVSL